MLLQVVKNGFTDRRTVEYILEFTADDVLQSMVILSARPGILGTVHDILWRTGIFGVALHLIS